MRKGLERGLIIVMAASLAVLGYVGVRLYQELVLKAEQTQVAIGGPFTLTDHTGAMRTEKDLLGHPSVVYFGYTYCPDVCPTEMINISAALEQLGPQAKEVRAYFITVDPERDTPEVMADFVAQMAYFVQVNSPAVITVQGDRASARSIIRECGKFADRDEALEILGCYDDELVRTDAGWRFARRVFRSYGKHTFALQPSAKP